MKKRQVLDIPGVHHQAPIPLGCRVGNLVYSSALMGMDPETSRIPDDAPAQVRLAFANVRALLAHAGASTDDVVFLNVFVADDSVRPLVNESWLEMFPDEQDRPARHTTTQDLPGNMLVQVEFVAVL